MTGLQHDTANTPRSGVHIGNVIPKVLISSAVFGFERDQSCLHVLLFRLFLFASCVNIYFLRESQTTKMKRLSGLGEA